MPLAVLTGPRSHLLPRKSRVISVPPATVQRRLLHIPTPNPTRLQSHSFPSWGGTNCPVPARAGHSGPQGLARSEPSSIETTTCNLPIGSSRATGGVGTSDLPPIKKEG